MKWFFSVLVCAALLTACSTTDPTPSEPDDQLKEFTLHGSASKDDVKVELYADTSLFAGYNDVYLKVTHKGKALNGTTTLRPGFVTCPMNIDCPVIQPGTTADSLGLLHAAIIFTMEGLPGEWKVYVDVVNNDDGKLTTLEIPVTVARADNVREVKTETGKALLALIPQPWKVGKNPIRIALFSGGDSTYTSVENATVVMTPSMPSMGHGSHGNINPTHVSDGIYQGTVNYSMSGEWKVDFAATLGTTQLIHTSFMVDIPK